MFEWQFTIRGTRVRITADRAPNGKIIIRANGRVVAAPLGEGEQERFFVAEGAQFHLQRMADGFRVQEVPIHVPAAAAAPAAETQAIVAQPDTVQRRIVLFALAGIVQMIVCLLLRLFYASEMTRLESAVQQIESRDDVVTSKPAMANTVAIVKATKRTIGLEAFVGFLMLAGAAMLLLRVTWAPIALEAVAWSIAGVALLGLIEIDLRTHRQFAFAYNQQEVAKFLGAVHTMGLMALIVAAIASGVLLSLLNRRALEAELQGADM